jgi:hypothetical protein
MTLGTVATVIFGVVMVLLALAALYQAVMLGSRTARLAGFKPSVGAYTTVSGANANTV